MNAKMAAAPAKTASIPRVEEEEEGEEEESWSGCEPVGPFMWWDDCKTRR